MKSPISSPALGFCTIAMLFCSATSAQAQPPLPGLDPASLAQGIESVQSPLGKIDGGAIGAMSSDTSRTLLTDPSLLPVIVGGSAVIGSLVFSTVPLFPAGANKPAAPAGPTQAPILPGTNPSPGTAPVTGPTEIPIPEVVCPVGGVATVPPEAETPRSLPTVGLYLGAHTTPVDGLVQLSTGDTFLLETSVDVFPQATTFADLAVTYNTIPADFEAVGEWTLVNPDDASGITSRNSSAAWGFDLAGVTTPTVKVRQQVRYTGEVPFSKEISRRISGGSISSTTFDPDGTGPNLPRRVSRYSPAVEVKFIASPADKGALGADMRAAIFSPDGTLNGAKGGCNTVAIDAHAFTVGTENLPAFVEFEVYSDFSAPLALGPDLTDVSKVVVDNGGSPFTVTRQADRVIVKVATSEAKVVRPTINLPIWVPADRTSNSVLLRVLLRNTANQDVVGLGTAANIGLTAPLAVN